jgi:hypothetical protein
MMTENTSVPKMVTQSETPLNPEDGDAIMH